MAKLTRYIPPEADRFYKLGEEFFLFSELKKEFIGGFTVVHATGRMIKVKSRNDSKKKTFHLFQIKTFYKPVHQSGSFCQTLIFFRSKSLNMDPPQPFLTELLYLNDSISWKYLIPN